MAPSVRSSKAETRRSRRWASSVMRMLLVVRSLMVPPASQLTCLQAYISMIGRTEAKLEGLFDLPADIALALLLLAHDLRRFALPILATLALLANAGRRHRFAVDGRRRD